MSYHHYPGEDESDQKRASAWASQYLAEPVRRFLEDGGALSPETLARLYVDTGMPLDNLKIRWRDDIAVGQMVEISPSARGGSRGCGMMPRSPEEAAR